MYITAVLMTTPCLPLSRLAVVLSEADKVDISHFDIIKVLGTGAYGKVYLVRKKSGHDQGQLYAMKVLKKATVVQKKKTAEHTKTERQVLEAVRSCPFLVRMYYAFQTDAKLYLILGKWRRRFPCYSNRRS